MPLLSAREQFSNGQTTIYKLQEREGPVGMVERGSRTLPYSLACASGRFSCFWPSGSRKRLTFGYQNSHDRCRILRRILWAKKIDLKFCLCGWNGRKTRFFDTFRTSRTSNSARSEDIDTPIAHFNRGNDSEQNCILSLASDITVLWNFFVLWKKKKYLIFSVRGIAYKKVLRRAINSRFSQFFSAQRIP